MEVACCVPRQLSRPSWFRPRYNGGSVVKALVKTVKQATYKHVSWEPYN